MWKSTGSVKSLYMSYVILARFPFPLLWLFQECNLSNKFYSWLCIKVKICPSYCIDAHNFDFSSLIFSHDFLAAAFDREIKKFLKQFSFECFQITDFHLIPFQILFLKAMEPFNYTVWNAIIFQKMLGHHLPQINFNPEWIHTVSSREMNESKVLHNPIVIFESAIQRTAIIS